MAIVNGPDGATDCAGKETQMNGTTNPATPTGRVRARRGRTQSAAGLLRGPGPDADDQDATSPAGAAFPPAGRRDRVPRVAALLTLAAGVLNLGSALLPAAHQRLSLLQRLVPGEISRAATVVTAAAGVGLLLLAGGLRRRRQTAWLVAVVLLGGSALLHLLKGLDFEEAVVEAFLAGLLAGQGGRFTARAGPGERRATAMSALGVAAVTAGYGILGLLANARDVAADQGVARLLQDVGRMALGLGSSLTLTGRFGRFFPTSVAAVFWLGVLAVAARALAPALVHHRTDPRLGAAVAAADDSLAYFALRDDRATVRAAHTLVSYRPVGTVALAAGDPLGPCPEWPQAARAFLTETAVQGRIAAVLGCGGQAARVWATAGLTTMYLGDEAVLDLERFSLQGRAVRIARQSWRRARRAGFTTLACRSSDLDPGTVAALRELSRRWRGEAVERGFSMALGRLFDPRDASALVVVARDAAGRPVGFLHFVPWGSDGASLDVMRRDRDGPSYLSDFLVVEAARRLPGLGVRRLSLNFSFLRAVIAAGAEPEVPLGLRAARWLLRRLSGPFQIETLYRFNKKFAPAWQPRYLAVETPEELPRVAIAALRAEGLLPTAPWHLPVRLPAWFTSRGADGRAPRWRGRLWQWRSGARWWPTAPGRGWRQPRP
jgi:lysyl-tRNA synthetase class 2